VGFGEAEAGGLLVRPGELEHHGITRGIAGCDLTGIVEGFDGPTDQRTELRHRVVDGRPTTGGEVEVVFGDGVAQWPASRSHPGIA